MDFGIFLPTSSVGYVPAHGVPEFDLDFENLVELTQRAEALGFGSALAMAKFRGPHGDTRYWNESFEPFTVAAALLARTRRIRVFATAGMLGLHPAMAAKMTSTLNRIAPGRAGLNIVTGWNPEEYSQMGLWPGDDYFSYRYGYAAEYVTVVRELLERGTATFRGRYFQTDDCECLPPAPGVPIVSAGSSGQGLEFAAEHTDFNFNTGPQAAESGAELQRLTAARGRTAGSYLLKMVIVADTDEEAHARVTAYNEATDLRAMGSRKAQAVRNRTGTGTSRRAAETDVAVPLGNAWVGSSETIARYVRETEDSGVFAGVMLQFDDFASGLERFGTEVLPLTRAGNRAENPGLASFSRP